MSPEKNTKTKLAKGLFTFNGITTILIGALHTYAHYSDLVTIELNKMLSYDIPVMGQNADVYKLWQGMSLMMGLLLIIVGLLVLVIVKNTPKDKYPPVAASLVFIAMLCCVIYAGANFFGPPQFYGGMFGCVLQSICLFLTLTKK